MSDETKPGTLTGLLHRAEDAVGGMIGTATAGSAAQTVESFVTEAWLSNLYEIQSADIAVRRSKSAEVVALAHRMIADHQSSQAALKVELDRMMGQFLIPAELDQRRQTMLDHLLQAPEDAFDTTYLSQQKLSHKEAITLFEAFEKRGEQQLLASYARANLPILRQHESHVNAAITARSELGAT